MRGAIISLALFMNLALCAEGDQVSAAFKKAIKEAPRQLPIAGEVDILVVGSNEGGIAAAITAAKQGSKVMLLAPDYYLGHEMAGKNRFWMEAGETPCSQLAERILSDLKPAVYKWRLEEELMNAGVEFLYRTYGTDVVVDGNRKIAGAIMNNKAGRQIIIAKVVIDATPMAGIAGLAGAQFTAWTNSTQRVSQTWTKAREGITHGDFNEFAIDIPMASGAWPDRSRAEHLLRKNVTHKHWGWRGDYLHMVEPRSIVARVQDNDSGATAINLDCLRPSGLDYLYVVGPALSTSRRNAAALIRPVNLIALGERVGAAAHKAAQTRQAPENISIIKRRALDFESGDVAEVLEGPRPKPDYDRYPTMEQGDNTLEVWAEYDVVVVGGGTAGAPAAIAAARAGARVLCVEMTGFLGGTETIGGVATFWKGYRKGFNQEFKKANWFPMEKAQWLFQELDKAGGHTWFNTMGCGVVKEGDKVKGVVVATPMGRGVVLADMVIDATGDGDISAAAGASFNHVNLHRMDMGVARSSYLGSGNIPEKANNHNEPFADPMDVYSMTYHQILGKREGRWHYRNVYDFYRIMGIRESRKIQGDYVGSYLDHYLQRTFPDLIAVGWADWDLRGPATSDEVHAGIMTDPIDYPFAVPLRAILPKGLKGILLAGRCYSVSSDALARVRMQPDLENLGYAAGYIAATAVRENKSVRELDLRPIQDHLVRIGNITSDDMTRWSAEMPVPTDQQLRKAAKAAAKEYNRALLLSAPERAIPILKEEFDKSPDVNKAQMLCFLGDEAGVEVLAEHIANSPLQGGIAIYQTKPYYAKGVIERISEMDGPLWALGLPGSEKAVKTLVQKLHECKPDRENHQSHIRTIAVSLARIGHDSAAKPLYDFLEIPGMMGHQKLHTDTDAYDGTSEFRKALLEIHIAVALYRSGDMNKRGESILKAYLKDWRGPFVRFAVYHLNDTANR